jgi:trk system potassium uptake protein TrkH
MIKNFNYKLILKITGGLLLLESLLLLLMILPALYFREKEYVNFLQSAVITFLTGIVLYLAGINSAPQISKREGSVIVTFTWFLMTFSGLLPFVLSGSIPSFTDAFFETMSGFTTTGASILNDIEALPYSILLWRSFIQWFGGLGIIVISIALLPIFGFSAVQLFSAEATGPTKDKIHPRMNETAKRLLLIYVVLTVLQIILLNFAGMSLYDAVNHAFTTMATGGFSTKQASIGHWNSQAIEYITIVFMLLAGVNFSLYYFLFKRNIRRVFENEEFRFYGLIVFSATVLIMISMLDFNNTTWFTFEKAFRDSLFNVVSLMSTTGFVTIDYMLLRPEVWFLLLFVMLVGASAGSTAGGMKVIRIVIILKYSYYEFKKIIHPNAVFPVSYNNHNVRDEVITRTLAFVIIYLIVIACGTVILSFSGLGFMESLSGMITCISDVGPGMGSIGPMYNFAHLNDFSKWFLSMVMLIGRLEIFTVLIIFTPVFWKK